MFAIEIINGQVTRPVVHQEEKFSQGLELGTEHGDRPTTEIVVNAVDDFLRRCFKDS